jgi:hypothetical protein
LLLLLLQAHIARLMWCCWSTLQDYCAHGMHTMLTLHVAAAAAAAAAAQVASTMWCCLSG